MRPAYVLGTAMTRFHTPRLSPNYIELGASAVREALADAQVDYADIEQVYAGYVYGDSCSAHRVMYEVGMTGIPIFNVNCNCSSGSNALYLARQAVASGVIECALAVGFEQMQTGALSERWQDRPSPLESFVHISDRWLNEPHAPLAPKLFAAAGREYSAKYGVSQETFAKIVVKSRIHAANNERAVFRAPLTVDEVLESPAICGDITRYQCCPPTCGSAAAVICSESFAKRHNFGRAVRIAGVGLFTDVPSSFGGSALDAVGFRVARCAAEHAYKTSGVLPSDIDVAELHDCFTVNELISYEALGFCNEGEASDFIASGANTYGGYCVTNPSGGLISKGHPLGATGIAQCFELVNQLRSEITGGRQVHGSKWALSHNFGIGGSCVVTIYEGST